MDTVKYKQNKNIDLQHRYTVETEFLVDSLRKRKKESRQKATRAITYEHKRNPSSP